MLIQNGSNLQKILANILWMLFDKVFLILLNLVVTVQVANYYGRHEYGTYEYAVSIVAIFEILVAFVDPRVVKKRYTSVKAEDIVWNAVFVRVLFSVFSLLGGIIYVLLSDGDRKFDIIFIILLFNAVIINLRFGMQNRYEYLLKSKKVIIAGNVGLAVGGILQLAAVMYQLPIIVIALITLVSSSLSLVIIYIQYYRDYGELTNGKFSRLLAKEFILESLPLAIAASCAIIYARCGTVMVGNMLTKADVGIYAISLKLISGISIMLGPIRESVYPKMIELYKKNKEEYAAQYVRITSLLTWLFILGALASFVVLPYLFRFLKPEYAVAFPIYQIFVFGVLFMYNAGLRAGHFTLIQRGDIVMYAQIVSVAINVVLNYFLIRQIGLYGAAVSTAITQGISLFISNLFFGKDGKEVFIWQLKGLNPMYCFKKQGIAIKS